MSKGDLVVINTGNKIPADLRLVQVSDLKTDNNSLIWEVEPQSRVLVLWE